MASDPGLRYLPVLIPLAGGIYEAFKSEKNNEVWLQI